ncbi:MAG TPA: HAMP domain-containing sensor histidine kinase [Armatimonadota bacterium]|nr:HAMP domain-containing sensor histidine kinase [Armatimonadota bacterium]
MVSDLTLTQELERERREAERLSLIRVISAGMAHEIRNPLVAIRTFAELAPDRMDDPEFRSKFLTVARSEIDRINKLVGDLLSLSKPADAVIEPVDVNAICNDVLSAVSGITESRHLNVELQAGELSGMPKGDPARIHQAILNVVSNAIDAEPPGGSLRVISEQDTDARGEPAVVVRVFNAGSYVSPSQTEDIFRPFYSRKERGTGLGLAICQTIVEEHGGGITVSSSPDVGTEFTITLPLSRRTAAAIPAGERALWL